jgi:cytidyltransferase-like protein
MKRIMVDMSATILHHGHVRLINKAKKYGKVIIGLTTDEEINKSKGYQPELSYKHRKELLEAINGVDEVVPTPWLLTEFVLDQYNIDLLVHGDDNSNQIPESRLLIVPRTEGISSSQIRENASRSITQINNQKLMLTPGPAVILHENIQYLKPVFGRGDDEYQQMATKVLDWIKQLSGQDEVVMAQGSATFALELAAHSFVKGKVLLVSTGYYSDRLQKLLPEECELKVINYDDLEKVQDEFDWVLCAYTETSKAFKVDLSTVKIKADQLGARLYVDATGSIGLEAQHELADVMAFSSCKGLFGLTGACFVAHKKNLPKKSLSKFYFNLETHENKMVTGPYHAVASLYGVMKKHDELVRRVKNSKYQVLTDWGKYIDTERIHQPLLCTYLHAKLNAIDDQTVMYTPRSDLPGSIVCHFGEVHHDNVQITHKLKIKELS